MRWWLVLGALGAGCVSSDAVSCGDGRICPVETECRALTDPDEQVCATHAQLDACDGKAPLDPCTLEGIDVARCYDGVCLASGCGNRRLDPGEVCDDGNNGAGDLCSPDCTSDETCGNGVVDPVNGEACDDRNLRSNDGCSSACAVEQLHWSQHAEHSPKRFEGVAAYDARRDRVVAFGGTDSLDLDREHIGTWEWNAADWSPFQGAAPPMRSNAAMAFDGERIVLNGGDGRNETWTYDGESWELITGTVDPGIRYFHMMAYDSRRRRVVLFGGTGATSDTWEFDGSKKTWSKITTAVSPPSRASALMAYDPARGVIVLAGGKDNVGANILADTWTYDGVNWTNVTPSGTAPQLALAAIAFDSISKRLIAFGGCETPSCVIPSSARTLAWDGATWTDLAITGPSPLSAAQIAATPRGIVLVGGIDDTNTVSDKTWLFDGSQWREPVFPAPDVVGMIANDFARDEILVIGGTSTTETWLLSASGWRTFAGTTPAVGTAIAYDPTSRTVLMFNGGTDETWEWNGSTWTDRTSAPSPPGSFGQGMAFDGVHVTTFGGVQSGPTAETWSWSGSAWVHATPAHAPSPRNAPITGYDPVRKQMVLFGGFVMGGVKLSDTWTYDGVDWTAHVVATHPPASSSGVLVWNPARERLVLGAAWEWDGTSWSALGSVDAEPRVGIVASSLDGTGTTAYGAVRDPVTQVPLETQHWELVWTAPALGELCNSADLDGDMLVGCADPDCWTVCSPLCPPGTSCNTMQTCGDGTCDPIFESCRTCADCTCTPTCGDLACDAGETNCPGDCP